MKETGIIAAIACVCAAIMVLAGTTGNSGATNETVDVATLLQAKYERDMKTESGRSWWHGRRISHVADPSNGVTVSVYEDGKRFRDAAKVTRPIDSVNAANSKMKRTVDTKGVPTKLAEARKRRERERGAVSNVTVTVRAGAAK